MISCVLKTISRWDSSYSAKYLPNLYLLRSDFVAIKTIANQT